jgi:hypothetical protein
MNTTYLSTEKIKQLSEICENTIPSSTKNRIKNLNSKFNIRLTDSKKINLNLFWNYCLDEMSKDPKRTILTGETFKQAVENNRKNGNNGIYIRDYVLSFIEKNYQSDYEFLSKFDLEGLTFGINFILRDAGLELDFQIVELLTIDNYEKFFSAKFGIKNCENKPLQATQTIVKLIDNLTKDIKHPEHLFQAISQYLHSKDSSEFHNTLNK